MAYFSCVKKTKKANKNQKHTNKTFKFLPLTSIMCQELKDKNNSHHLVPGLKTLRYQKHTVTGGQPLNQRSLLEPAGVGQGGCPQSSWL